MNKKRSHSSVRYKTQIDEPLWVNDLHSQNITDRVASKVKLELKNQPLTVSVWDSVEQEDHNKQNVSDQNRYMSKRSAPLKHPKDIFFKAIPSCNKDKGQTDKDNQQKQQRMSLKQKPGRFITEADEDMNIKYSSSQGIFSQKLTIEEYKHLVQSLQAKCKKYEIQLMKCYERQNQKRQSQKQQQKMVMTSSFLNDPQNQQKNVFIKQINIKNTKIDNLSQQISLLKREQQTLRNYIQQQEKQIKEQQTKLLNYETQKQKVSKYEIELQNNQNILKDIETQMIKIKQEQFNKDNAIRQYTEKLNQTVQQIKSDEDKLLSLERETLKLKKNLDKAKQDNKCLEQQLLNQKQKQSSEKVTRQKLQKLIKQKDGNIELMKKRIMEDKEEYEAKVRFLNQQHDKQRKGLQKKLSQGQKQANDLKKQLKTKISSIQKLEVQFSQYMNNNQERQKLCEQLIRFKQKADIGDKKIRIFENQLNQKTLLIQNLNAAIGDLKEENGALGSKLQNNESIISENHELTNTVLSKISVIQQLQNTISVIQNKLESCQKDLIKTKLEKECKEKVIDDYLESIRIIEQKVQQEEHKKTEMLRQIQELKEHGQQRQQQNQVLVRTIDQQKNLLTQLIQGINKVNEQIVSSKKQIADLHEECYNYKARIQKLDILTKSLNKSLQEANQGQDRMAEYASSIAKMCQSIQQIKVSRHSVKYTL